jgi:uncharacterized protein
MADNPNTALLRKGYEAFAAGDLDTIRGLFADDVVWHVPGRNPLAGDYKGIDDVFGFFGKLLEVSGGTFKMDVHTVVADDEHGVALVHVTGDRGGKRLDQNNAHVFHISAGKVTEFWGFNWDDYADDEFLS